MKNLDLQSLGTDMSGHCTIEQCPGKCSFLYFFVLKDPIFLFAILNYQNVDNLYHCGATKQILSQESRGVLIEYIEKIRQI